MPLAVVQDALYSSFLEALAEAEGQSLFEKRLAEQSELIYIVDRGGLLLPGLFNGGYSCFLVDFWCRFRIRWFHHFCV